MTTLSDALAPSLSVTTSVSVCRPTGNVPCGVTPAAAGPTFPHLAYAGIL